MKVVIIGVRHSQQPDERDADPSELRSAKDALEKSIHNVIESYEIRLICEESRSGVYTIAQRLADRHNPRIRWVPIEMSPEDEQAAGIPNATERNKKRRYLDEETMIWREQRIPEDEVRERFFVEKISREAGNENAETILVVCGCGHAQPLKEKFQTLAEQLEVVWLS